MKQQCPTPVSDVYLQTLKEAVNDQQGKGVQDDCDVSVEMEGAALVATPDDVLPTINGPPTPEPIQPHTASSTPSDIVIAPSAPTKWSSDEAVAQADLPDVPLRFQEKKRLHWSDKTCK